jgi:hypothetical protein
MAISNVISTLGMDGYALVNADFGSDFVNIGPARSASVQVVLTNSNAAGTLRVQTSNNKSNWVNVPFVDETNTIVDGYSVTSGNNVNHIFDLTDISSSWARLKYESTSGRGSMHYYWQLKRF